MPYAFNDIVRQWYEELKLPFINYLRKNFIIDYDDVMDIYTNVWIDVRSNIQRGAVKPGTKWKAYIFKIGWYQANNRATRRPIHVSLDGGIGDGDDAFDPVVYEAEQKKREHETPTVYQDPELQAVLAAELSYIPNTCNQILKFFYYDNMTMSDIAAAMNYASANTAKTTKNRCMDKLKERMRNAVRRLGIID